MRFSGINGAGEVRAALVGMVDSGRVPHALMFHEDDGGGAVTLCMAFLQYLMCPSRSASDSCGVCPSCNKVSKMIHPDVHFIFPVVAGTLSASFAAGWRELVLGHPSFRSSDLEDALGFEGKSPVIAVQEIKSLLDTLSLSALEGGWRCVVIYLPEKMNQEAANRLLKIVEEPPEKTQFLMVTHAPEMVLPTIRSRCQCIRVTGLDAGGPEASMSESEQQYSALMDSLMAAVLGRDLVAALEVGEEIAALPSRERVKGFCNFAAGSLRRLFLLQQGMASLAGIPAEEFEKYSGWAGRLRKSYPRTALETVSRARRLVERNVAQKIVMADMVDALFFTV